MSAELKTAAVWMHPTKSSPACRYSFDPLGGKVRGVLTQGRAIHSDCGIWKTYFDKALVVAPESVSGDICPFCKAGIKVATPTLTTKPRRPSNIPLRHLHHDA